MSEAGQTKKDGFRPDIEGMRGIAVLLVVLSSHLQLSRSLAPVLKHEIEETGKGWKRPKLSI